MKHYRHLRIVEEDDGISPEQISIEDGIREAMTAGRMTQEIGEACMGAYRRSIHHYDHPNVYPLFPESDDAA